MFVNFDKISIENALFKLRIPLSPPKTQNIVLIEYEMPLEIVVFFMQIFLVSSI